jgi:ribonuclease HI
MLALKLGLKLAQEYGDKQIHIFGDSLLVIQWMKHKTELRNDETRK